MFLSQIESKFYYTSNLLNIIWGTFFQLILSSLIFYHTSDQIIMKIEIISQHLIVSRIHVSASKIKFICILWMPQILQILQHDLMTEFLNPFSFL